jgi:hypothetical protein
VENMVMPSEGNNCGRPASGQLRFSSEGRISPLKGIERAKSQVDEQEEARDGCCINIVTSTKKIEV